MMNRMLMLLCLLVPTATLARPGGGGGRGHFNPKMLMHAADMLELDDETRKRIKDLVYDSEKAGIELRARVKAAELELHRALDAEAPDRSEVMKRVEEVGTLKVEMQKHRFGLMLDVRGLLTPEQVRKLKTMRHEFRERRRHQRRKRGKERRRGRRGGGDGPPDDDALE